ncbi:hypothetical protein BX666DRAFT_2040594 [Dichotomocladium elegans]|nr:hypothetical protein BX666DRAFT_2040594 [Dichotomocladium elegans]
MCGRFACSLCPNELRIQLRSNHIPVNDEWKEEEYFRPSYNVAPRSWIPVVRRAEGDNLILQTMKWGFIPSWAKTIPENQPINARDETLNVGSPVFDGAKSNGRCIVAADGFYEWKKLAGGKKIPHYTKRRDGKLMLFAALFDRADDVDGIEESQSIYTCAIVTTSPSKAFSFLHDRMPVILENGSFEVGKWLSAEPWSKDISKLMRPYDGDLDIYQVTDAVGPITGNSPDFVLPVDSLKGSISNFFKKSTSSLQTHASPKRHIDEVDKDNPVMRVKEQDMPPPFKKAMTYARDGAHKLSMKKDNTDSSHAVRKDGEKKITLYFKKQ